MLNETTDSMDEAQPQDTDESIDIRKMVESKNIADELDEEELAAIGAQCKEGFEADLRSRKDWESKLEEWQKLALQVKEDKTWPWTGASNVKYPLLSIAALQFNARSYPSLIPATSDVVKCEVIGKDPTGEKLAKAKRIGSYMSYQVLNKMDCWEEDMDRLLIMLPIIGTMFKKTFYDSVIKQNVSEIVLPKNLVVDYWAKSLESAERVSEMMQFNKRLVKEKMMGGQWLEVELGEPRGTDAEPNKNIPVPTDTTTPYSIIEQHCYFDLDEDDYAEPYIVTFERFSGKVLRMVARFDDESIKMVGDKLAKIEPIQYYTKFSFIPNPEGGFYDIGFGLLLSPLNESVNTLINQLIDAGTLNNLQGGFLGKGLKLKMGQSQWQPGEWKSVQSTADDLRKQIVQLPTKEPSDILFKLMGSLITGSKELASIAEIFVGKTPGQNTPATTTMATIEQGMKVFTAVYKRVYRSLRSEFKKVFRLNATYLDEHEYAAVVDQEIAAEDFDYKSYDICPGADPNTATATEKLMKAQGLMELLPSGVLDPVKVVMRVLEAQEQPNFEELFTDEVQQTGKVTPPPDPKMLELQMKSDADQKKFAAEAQNDAFQRQLDARDQQFQMAMEGQKQERDARHEQLMGQIKASSTLHMDQARVQGARAKVATDVAGAQQKMVMNQQTHHQSMAHKEEAAKLQRQQAAKNSTKTGKPTR